MNIMWCSIFEATPTMFAVSEQLRAEGHRVFWSAAHYDWHSYLTRMGIVEREILDLRVPRGPLPSPSPEVFDALVRAEHRTGLTVATAVMADRFATSRRKGGLEVCVVWMFAAAHEFLRQNSVAAVLGEPCNATDLATYLACEALEIPYIHIASIRIQKGSRSALFKGVTESSVVRLPALTSTEMPHATVGVGSGEERPFWFAQNSNPAIYRHPPQILKVLRKTLRKPARIDFESYSPMSNLEVRMKTRLNAFWVRKRLPSLIASPLPSRFVLFALQVQPERSVDVFAPFASNQLEAIKNTRRALPSDVVLVVKEHPNLLGSRGRSFFRAVARLPATYLAAPSTNSFELVRRSVAVVSISSTIVLEAALMGVPAVALAPLWFTRLSKARYCSDLRQLWGLIVECGRSARDEAADDAILSEIAENSVEGLLVDPRVTPWMDFDANATQLARLVSAYLKSLAD